MKKHIFETKKTKLIARVMLLVLLLASALSFAGCGEPHVKKGQYYKESYTDHSLALKIVSNTEEFALNDVTFRVYIGLHKRSHSLIDWLTTKKNELLYKTYDISEIPYYNENQYYVVFAINYKEIENMTSNNILDHAYILREVSFEESLENGEYNFTKMPFGSDYYYNHCEDITILSECLINETGNKNSEFCVGIALAPKDENTEKYNIPTDYMYIGLQYNINSDGSVDIDLVPN